MEKFPISHHHDLPTTNTSSSITTTTSSTTTSNNNSQCLSPYNQYCYQYHQAGVVQFPYAPGQYSFPVPFVVGPNGAVLGVANPQSALLSREQERRLFEAWMTKAARTKRKLARQRSLNLTRSNSSTNNSSSCTPNSSSGVVLRQRDCTRENTVLPVCATAHLQNHGIKISTVNRDLYTFCTPDKKRLRALLKKELKNSDVGSLGRIVLPKREAEEKLPILSDKEGIQVLVRDFSSNQKWSLKYKYWLNNKSRMYVLENTGDFVKQNGLEIGDSITLYEDECKNLYFSIKKGERAASSEAIEKQLDLPDQNTNDNNSPNSNDSTEYSSSRTEETYDNLYAKIAYELSKDEDEASLARLIEQLDDMEQQEANSLATSSHIDGNSSTHDHIGHLEEAKCDIVTGKGTSTTQPLQPPSPTSCSNTKTADDHFDDCYGGLGTLPEVDQCRYYGYAAMFDRILSDKS